MAIVTLLLENIFNNQKKKKKKKKNILRISRMVQIEKQKIFLMLQYLYPFN